MAVVCWISARYTKRENIVLGPTLPGIYLISWFLNFLAENAMKKIPTHSFIQAISWFSRNSWISTKGQLISKCFFGVFNFSQKTNENKSTLDIIVVKSNFFVLFWENWGYQKVLLKLTDLYIYIISFSTMILELVFWYPISVSLCMHITCDIYIKVRMLLKQFD